MIKERNEMSNIFSNKFVADDKCFDHIHSMKVKDYKKDYKDLYLPKSTPEVIEVGEIQFVGDYTTKFISTTQEKQM